jgi:CHAD domain-containing protein
VPRRFRTTLAGLVGDRALTTSATTTTRRTVRHLLDEHDRVLATVTDDRVDAVRLGPDNADRPTLVSWRDVQVTIVDGHQKLLHRLGKALTDAGARPADSRWRLADVLDGESQRPEAPSRPRDRTQQLIQHRVSDLVLELRARDPLVREGLPEGVHTMRVAVRRLRSMLATGRPFLDREATDPLRDELAWLADALGEVRDSEVRRERLDSSIDALVDERAEVDWEPDRVRSALWAPLVEQHDRALAALDEVLASERYVRLLDRLLDLVAAPSWTERADTRIRGAYLRRTRQELERVNQLMEAAHDPLPTLEERALALHDARRATKRARYAVEPLRPVYGDPAATLTTSLKALQTALGEHQDTVVTRAYLHDLVQQTRPPLDPAAALAAGALIERESRAAEEYDLQADGAWQAVARSPRLG